MSNTFYWHDYETFGLRGDERRPSQFAGVRTDENLNFIGLLQAKPRFSPLSGELSSDRHYSPVL